MSKVHIMNLSLMRFPSKRYYGSVDIKVSITPSKYIYINNVGICMNNRGVYYLEFPNDSRSRQRNHSCIVPSRELRRDITDEVLSLVYKTERMNENG